MPRLTAIRKQALDEMMKEAIFEATVVVLAEHGVEGMTMDRVALAANVAKGSVYNYFRSKKDLLQFVYTKTIEPVFRDLKEAVAMDRPAVEKLSMHVRQIIEHVAKHAEIFRLLFRDDTAHGLLQSSERSTREMGCRLLAEVFRQGIAEGAFRPGDPLMLARMFLGLCTGVFDGHPELDLERLEVREGLHQLVLSTFVNGIAATERAS
jgi:AcrR family transcriptional regulator